VNIKNYILTICRFILKYFIFFLSIFVDEIKLKNIFEYYQNNLSRTKNYSYEIEKLIDNKINFVDIGSNLSIKFDNFQFSRDLVLNKKYLEFLFFYKSNLFETKRGEDHYLNIKNLCQFKFNLPNIFFYPEFNLYSVNQINDICFKKYFNNKKLDYLLLKKNNIAYNLSDSLNKFNIRNAEIFNIDLIGIENSVFALIETFRPILVRIKVQTYKIINHTITFGDVIEKMNDKNFILVEITKNLDNLENDVDPFMTLTFLKDIRKEVYLTKKDINLYKAILLIFGFDDLLNIFKNKLKKYD